MMEVTINIPTGTDLLINCGLGAALMFTAAGAVTGLKSLIKIWLDDTADEEDEEDDDENLIETYHRHNSPSYYAPAEPTSVTPSVTPSVHTPGGQGKCPVDAFKKMKIIELYKQGMSKTKTCIAVFGGKGGYQGNAYDSVINQYIKEVENAGV